MRGGRSGVLVVRGEPGVGKTALVQYAVGAASGFRVARTVGVESEVELAFAALQQLCAPMLDRLERLAVPQREALGAAFGLGAGTAPERSLVGLAALNLLSGTAHDKPLLCVVDDAQWLDRASAQALAFVARRLLADPVAVVFATRVQTEELAGLPELIVDGLRDDDARALLASTISVKGAKTWFRHAAARWYSWRSPPSRSRRSIAACGGGGVGGWVARGGVRPSARCGRSVL